MTKPSTTTTEKRKRGRPRKDASTTTEKSEPILMTMSQYAKHRKPAISRQRVYQLVRDRKIKSRMIGGKKFVVVE